MYTVLKRGPVAQKWFIAAGVLLALFIIYTAIFSTGALLNPVLHADQWLLHRPLTGFDCVFRRWKPLGDPPLSLFLVVVVGLACVWLGYRRRVLPYLVLLLLLGIGVEFVGKQVFYQPLPDSLGNGMGTLWCPQIFRQPRSVRLLVTLGMWWEAPPSSQKAVRKEQVSATTPFTLDDTNPVNGYPSGHAIRWSFLGLIVGWLFWRQVRHKILRRLLMAIAFAIALGGGFIMFYIGLHLLSDLIGGYLLGASTACCAIGLLARNETRRRLLPPLLVNRC